MINKRFYRGPPVAAEHRLRQWGPLGTPYRQQKNSRGYQGPHLGGLGAPWVRQIGRGPLYRGPLLWGLPGALLYFRGPPRMLGGGF